MKASDISDAHILALIADRTVSARDVLDGEGFPEKVVEAKYRKLDNRGLLIVGVSLTTAWLSEKGYAELARLTEGQLA